MNAPIAAFLSILYLLSASENSFARGWALMAPDLKIIGTKVTPTNDWVALESFATLVECNDRRSSMIRQIDKERRELREVDDRSAEMTERELRLLWDIYTKSKCVWSR